MREGYRKDIDGLRAVAVLAVLFYHAGLWPFAAGYVGVDVFFVLSGYLITGLILREGAGFSLLDFYDRRVRRILPALGVVLAATTVAALFVLLPVELVPYGKNLAGAVLFSANVLYWLRGLPYFGPSAGENPLLHVWSLSVEEQFYLLWPLLLVFLARFRRALPWAIAALAAASLATALVFAVVNPLVSFYLLPSRAWQLLIGGFLALGVVSGPRRAPPRNAIAVVGLALVLAAAFLPGPLAHFHPLNAMGAAFGAGAILFAAEGGPNLVRTLLATRLPVFIGRISYSLYLWHWPLLVFARLYANRALTAFETAAVLLAAFAIATASWAYVEEPIRRRRFASWHGVPASFAVAAVAGAALLVPAVIFVVAHGLPERVPADVRALDAFIKRPPEGWCDPAGKLPAFCVRGDPRAAGEAVLWGDSHAWVLHSGLDGFLAARHWRLREFTQSACPPLPALDRPAGDAVAVDERCAAFNRAALSAIVRSDKVRLVILGGRWQSILAIGRVSGPDAPRRLERAFEEIFAVLARRGIPVLVVGNVADFPFVPALCYGRARLFGRDPGPCMALPRAAALAQIGPTDALIARAAARHPGMRAFFPSAVLCDRAGCHAFLGGRLLYTDSHHLSRSGAELVGEALV
ncbi:MAG TPA: acyltransferase family protein, partial [Rhizomicrobium sp.]